jgi:hypothetical protein
LGHNFGATIRTALNGLAWRLSLLYDASGMSQVQIGDLQLAETAWQNKKSETFMDVTQRVNVTKTNQKLISLYNPDRVQVKAHLLLLEPHYHIDHLGKQQIL